MSAAPASPRWRELQPGSAPAPARAAPTCAICLASRGDPVFVARDLLAARHPPVQPRLRTVPSRRWTWRRPSIPGLFIGGHVRDGISRGQLHRGRRAPGEGCRIAPSGRVPLARAVAGLRAGGSDRRFRRDDPALACPLPLTQRGLGVASRAFSRMAQELKDTLQMPRTGFPDARQASCSVSRPALHTGRQLGLYEAIQKRRAGAPVFVLHDGPPFTNGDVHIGTALNKTLKDVILRYKSMRGFRTPYVPGWDCHGLPIEQRVSRELQARETAGDDRPGCARSATRFPRPGSRSSARSSSASACSADWAQEYRTKDPAFEADILRTFAAFIEKGLVYRAKKPVYWSIPFETALAEAEIEYKDHVSPSIWVKFPLPAEEARKVRPARPTSRSSSSSGRRRRGRCQPTWRSRCILEVQYASPIRRRTPTSSPRSSARAVHQRRQGGESADRPQGRCQMATGAELRGPRRPAIPSSTAPRPSFSPTTSRPTAAPGACTRRRATGSRITRPGSSTVSRSTARSATDGRFIDDGRVPADLVGLTHARDGRGPGQETHLAGQHRRAEETRCRRRAAREAAFTHSYPHCWRSKTPIVFRAVDQWFVSLDKAGVRQQALEAIADRSPGSPPGARRASAAPSNRARIGASAASASGACRSRRSTTPEHRAYLDAGVVRAIADKVETQGTNLWFDGSPAQILEGIRIPAGWPAPRCADRRP